MIDVYISAVSRTPLGGFNGSLASLQATKLGSLTIECKYPPVLPFVFLTYKKKSCFKEIGCPCGCSGRSLFRLCFTC